MEQAEAESSVVTGFDSVPSQVLVRILQLLPPKDLARAACVQTSWRNLATDDSLWEAHCLEEFLQRSCETPAGEPCSLFRLTYIAWHTSFARYGTAFLCVRRFLTSLRSWSKEHCSGIAETLRGGVTEEALDESEEQLGVRFPAALRVLYRLCDGQERHLARSSPNLNGMFGGYFYYNCLYIMSFLPLVRLVLTTLTFRLSFPKVHQVRRRIAFGGNLALDRPWPEFGMDREKTLWLDVDDGLVYAGIDSDDAMIRCMPPEVGLSHTGDHPRRLPETTIAVADRGPRDGVTANPLPSGGTGFRPCRSDGAGFLLWLEEFQRQLEAGEYTAQPLLWPQTQSLGISLYPQLPPRQTTAVTRGVEVKCSAAFAPELTTMTATGYSYAFTYQVRMRLLPPAPGEWRAAEETVQLRSRHWVIKEKGVTVTEVHGAAVVGLFPLLIAGGDEFLYQSASGITSPDPDGSMEGEFEFIPGSILRPQGEPFWARIVPFPLRLPAFVY